MSLKLIAPGLRGKYFYAKGSINGKQYEHSLKTQDRETAEIRKAELEIALRTETTQPDTLTFSYAANKYLEFRSPSDRDTLQVNRLIDVLGDMPVDEVMQADLVEAADIILPGAKPGNKNRWVMRVGAAVLHYAAENSWCAYRRIKLFKEPRPVTRATTTEDQRKLIASASKPIQQLFLLWISTHGDRVTDAANIEWKNIDLEKRKYRYFEHKKDKWREAVLSDAVLLRLVKLKAELKDNIPQYLFPWRSRHSVYNWLRPLTKTLGVKFSPHMARHSVGKNLQVQGASLRVIMDRLGHDDIKSSMRYQSNDDETIRLATNTLPALD